MLRRLAIVLSLLASPPSSAAGFVALDLPGSQLTTIADDGRSAAGSLVGTRGGGFRWRQDHGARLLPDALSVRGLSPSGRYVAGSSLDRNAGEVATWWDAGDVAHPVDGATPSIGRTIDDAGELRGTADAGDGRRIAFRWTADEGVRWLPADDTAGLAACANPAVPDAPASGAQAVEYVAASRDGGLRVGHTGSGSDRRAVAWTAREGVQPLDVFLAAHGVEVPRDWILVAATAVAPDARHIGGYGLYRQRFDSFVAELPADPRLRCDPSPAPARTRTPPPRRAGMPRAVPAARHDTRKARDRRLAATRPVAPPPDADAPPHETEAEVARWRPRGMDQRPLNQEITA